MITVFKEIRNFTKVVLVSSSENSDIGLMDIDFILKIKKGLKWVCYFLRWWNAPQRWPKKSDNLWCTGVIYAVHCREYLVLRFQWQKTNCRESGYSSTALTLNVLSTQKNNAQFQKVNIVPKESEDSPTPLFHTTLVTVY